MFVSTDGRLGRVEILNAMLEASDECIYFYSHRGKNEIS